MIFTCFKNLKKLLGDKAYQPETNELTPPPESWIENVKQEAIKSRRVANTVMYLGAAAHAALCILVFTSDSPRESFHWWSIQWLIALALFIVSVFVIFPLVVRAERWTGELQDGENSAKAAILAMEVPLCHAYQKRVQEQGRTFIGLDYLIMKELAKRSTGITPFDENNLALKRLKESAAPKSAHPVTLAVEETPSENLAGLSLRDLSLAVMGSHPLSSQQLFHMESIANDIGNPMHEQARAYLKLQASLLQQFRS